VSGGFDIRRETVTWWEEKIVFALSIFGTAAAAWIGAILSDEETTWLFVTVAASTLTSGFLALVFRRPTEGIGVVIGRCGIAIMGGVLGTRIGVTAMHIQPAHSDPIYLAGVTTMVCAAAFFVGFALVRELDESSPKIAKRIMDWLLNRWLGK
jgi:peptidoglycan/LPS O-acetylase OafA/YrhL